jgi:antirestriction protein ArdC
MSQSTQEALARIEQGIEAARDSKRFREYLAFCGRFHRYSVANQLLIWTQRPTATLVAGFRGWSTTGRHVRKGEKGIMILAPMPHKRKVGSEDDEPQEAMAVHFRPVHVFDVSQTEGDELPTPVTPLRGDDGGIWEMLATVAKAERLNLSREARADELASGFYVRLERRIWVRPDLAPLQAGKTLAHELSHHFAKHNEKGHSRDEAEMIAESSAFVVMAHLGCDAGEYSFGYLASWGDVKLFKARLQEIHDTAEALISKLESSLRSASIARASR